jgi:hypothetical protein
MARRSLKPSSTPSGTVQVIHPDAKEKDREAFFEVREF